jgi:hypothetical protein
MRRRFAPSGRLMRKAGSPRTEINSATAAPCSYLSGRHPRSMKASMEHPRRNGSTERPNHPAPDGEAIREQPASIATPQVPVNASGRSYLSASHYHTNSRRHVRPPRGGYFGLSAHVDITEACKSSRAKACRLIGGGFLLRTTKKSSLAVDCEERHSTYLRDSHPCKVSRDQT